MLSERRLKAELEKRGDKKLADRDKLAEQFTKSIVNDSNLEQYGDDIVKYMADLYELPEEKLIELNKDERIGEYFLFYRWIKTLYPEATTEELLSIPEESAPCWICLLYTSDAADE